MIMYHRWIERVREREDKERERERGTELVSEVGFSLELVSGKPQIVLLFSYLQGMYQSQIL